VDNLDSINCEFFMVSHNINEMNFK